MSEEKTEVKTGERHNQGKLRWRNFPLFLIRPLIQVAHYGEKKYATFNFLKGLTILDCYDSMMRHLDLWLDPNEADFDAESGIHHLAHAAWNALMIVYFQLTRPELDGRWHPERNPEGEITEEKT